MLSHSVMVRRSHLLARCYLGTMCMCTTRHLDQPATKQTLAQWISLALGKALSPNNITKGFSATGIYPLNRHAVDKDLTPSETFGRNSAGGVTAEVGEGGSQQLDSGEQGSDEEEEGNEGDGEVGLPPIEELDSRLTLHCS
jgi:hypothetical protein